MPCVFFHEIFETAKFSAFRQGTFSRSAGWDLQIWLLPQPQSQMMLRRFQFATFVEQSHRCTTQQCLSIRLLEFIDLISLYHTSE